MEKQADPLPFLTPGQAAKLLNLPTYRIHHLIYSKKLPASKWARNGVFLQAKLTKFIQGP